ncbi:DUF190 domain-containing protein [Biomaibacter acetigenes]|uniref:DUF190 domain-containing protein n=1 Tax=Biomaibacter acetigenes TaxID=2316383 RepID=A0A3G2R3U2_9FIRM|nr:DUF190 domain-containing protein [Biomaibacter acetigenes]AYO29607.1 DUF190 domain-containing protein [Biomaibacter acetigenes]RKL61675.1 DUF190 domain-containing protein [Thermoanaerobacteraceae bacterium SP2]
MKIQGKGKMLKIFIGESDKWHGEPLFHAIVKLIKKEGMAGVTVYRGIEGFGANSRIHSTQILRLSEDLPVVLEIIDTPERINFVLDKLDAMIKEGLMVVLQDVDIIKYTHSKE